MPGTKQIARAYQRQLGVATELVCEARTALISLAQCSPSFDLLKTIPYIGDVRAAEILAIAGDPGRFRSLRAFWSYAGLGVIQKVSAEHRVENGHAVRHERSRGIKLRVGHPLLKKVIRDIALHASLRRGYFKEVFDAHVARGKTPAVARVALARKIAATILAVWRQGTPYVNPK
jgi:transposase